MEKHVSGLSRKEACRLAFQLAKQKGCKYFFHREKEAAGRKRLKKFLSRNPNFAFRTPRCLPPSSAHKFTPEAAAKFSHMFEYAMAHITHAPNSARNYDDTGITVRAAQAPKLFFQIGKRQRGRWTQFTHKEFRCRKYWQRPSRCCNFPSFLRRQLRLRNRTADGLIVTNCQVAELY